jgi:hypothetical protein
MLINFHNTKLDDDPQRSIMNCSADDALRDNIFISLLPPYSSSPYETSDNDSPLLQISTWNVLERNISCWNVQKAEKFWSFNMIGRNTMHLYLGMC